MEFLVSALEDGRRLDVVLAGRVPEISRMRLRQVLDEDGVHVGGEKRAAGWRVTAGDVITLEIDPTLVTAMTPEAIPLEILFEDQALIVLNKPAGMVVHPVSRHRSGTLLNALAHHFNVIGCADPPIRAGLAHRLDRATSGLMVVTKTQEALSRLTVQFQQRTVRKLYTALVHGEVQSDSGEWSAPIGSDPEAWPRWGIRAEGRPASTRYQVRSRNPGHTLLALEPITGRTNQLRLHCAHFGHPILGDDLFGRGQEDEIGRLFLHASKLEFIHPVQRQPLEFESPMPSELTRFLNAPDPSN